MMLLVLNNWAQSFNNMLTNDIVSFEQTGTVLCVRAFVGNWQLPFLNQQKWGLILEMISWSISMSWAAELGA